LSLQNFESRLGTGLEPAPHEFNDLHSSVHHGWRRNQYEMAALKLDAPDKLLVYVILNG
jgi:hypothetical protein